MENRGITGFLLLPLAARTHVVALFILAYFVICARTDGGVSAAELVCGVCFAALLQLAYLFNKLYDRAEDAFNGEPALLGGAPRPARALLLAGVFAAICALLAAVSTALVPVLLYSAAVTFAYSHPAVRLKGFLLLKPFVNTLNFFVVAFMVPFLLRDSGAWAYAPQLFLAAWRMLAAVLSLTLMFDVRDMRGDARAGIRTLPALTGRVPLLSAVAASALFLGGVDLLSGVYLSAANQLALGLFALGAFRERGRRYYDWLVLAEIVFLAVMLWVSV